MSLGLRVKERCESGRIGLTANEAEVPGDLAPPSKLSSASRAEVAGRTALACRNMSARHVSVDYELAVRLAFGTELRMTRRGAGPGTG